MIDLAAAAYIAGLLDGEGYIGIRRRNPTKANRMKSPRFCACLAVAMTDEEPVRFVARAAGKENLVSSRDRGTNKRIFEIGVERDAAAGLLRTVLPYLIAKKRQAELALELHELYQTSRQHRTRVIGEHVFKGGARQGGSYRVFGLSDEFIARCAALHEKALRGAARSGNGARFRR